jgi:hypothetical protein
MCGSNLKCPEFTSAQWTVYKQACTWASSKRSELPTARMAGEEETARASWPIPTRVSDVLGSMGGLRPFWKRSLSSITCAVVERCYFRARASCTRCLCALTPLQKRNSSAQTQGKFVASDPSQGSPTLKSQTPKSPNPPEAEILHAHLTCPSERDIKSSIRII